MMSINMVPVPADHPLMKAWTAYKATDDFGSSRKWAKFAEHVDGSLWAAFTAGFYAATERAAMLHENVQPASDEERLNKVPGAG